MKMTTENYDENDPNVLTLEKATGLGADLYQMVFGSRDDEFLDEMTAAGAERAL